jgi:hypothetical protein
VPLLDEVPGIVGQRRARLSLRLRPTLLVCRLSLRFGLIILVCRLSVAAASAGFFAVPVPGFTGLIVAMGYLLLVVVRDRPVVGQLLMVYAPDGGLWL